VASYIALNYWELAAASVFVFMNAGLSVIFSLRVHRSMLVAAIRMVVQLALVGLVLTTLFSIVSPLWTGLAVLGMVLFAGPEPLVRPTLCDTASRDDFGQLHDRHCLGSRHPDDEPRQPPCKCGSAAHARCYQTRRRCASNARGAP